MPDGSSHRSVHCALTPVARDPTPEPGDAGPCVPGRRPSRAGGRQCAPRAPRARRRTSPPTLPRRPYVAAPVRPPAGKDDHHDPAFPRHGTRHHARRHPCRDPGADAPRPDALRARARSGARAPAELERQSISFTVGLYLFICAALLTAHFTAGGA